MKLTRRQLRRLINETVQEGMDLAPSGKSTELDGKPAYEMHSSVTTIAGAKENAAKGPHSGAGRWKAQKEDDGIKVSFVEKDGAIYLVATPENTK